MSTRTRAVVQDDPSSDIVHPREFLSSVRSWFAGLDWASLRSRWLDLDKDHVIHQLVERPGSRVLWALKLGRFPKTAQDSLRDNNTVAGMLVWVWLLSFALALIAAA